MYGYCSGSQSQNVLCTAVTAGVDVTDHKRSLMDPRSPEEILADELPNPDAPDAMEKTAIRSHAETPEGTRYYNYTLTYVSLTM